nr:hypothetical protein CFP56_43213 [Quercus suber]
MAVNALPHSSRTGPPTVQKWKPPEHGLVKVNCDGARFTKENSAGVGVVIRNSEGLVLGSLSKLVPQAYSPLEIEATAIATALEFASDLGCQRAIIETDSLVLVKALQEDTEFLSAVGLVLDEIRLIHHCGFTDLGYTGSPFTWSRNHLVDGRTYILLDRALATIAWKSLFQNTVVQHMPTFVSDHSVLIVNLPSIRHRQPKLQPPFRFEAMWLKDPHCVEVVQKALMEGLYKLEGTPITMP